MTEIYARILPYQKTAAALAAENDIPLQGERVRETDTGREKTGNGGSHYNDLPYDDEIATGAGAYTHTQATPAATWTIPNPLGRKAGAVTVLIADVVVEADVTIPNDATTPIVVVFATPQSGRAQII